MPRRGHTCRLALAACAVFLVTACSLPHGAVRRLDAGPETSDVHLGNDVESDADVPCGSATDPFNCGICGRVCASNEDCIAGACVAVCPTGQHSCSGRCTDLATDPTNCGGCGLACTGGSRCITGVCSCPPGMILCGGRCVNTMNDGGNCGGCGHVCLGGQVCSSGTCMAHCPAGQMACGASCVDLATDPSNCGACDRACTAAHATTSCVGRVCTVSMCDPGYQNCNGAYADGCEVDTTASPANCGSCGHVCGTLNGTASCAGGVCGITCAAGYADCDHANANGCETHTATDLDNCGSCGARCALANASSACVGGACTISVCFAPYQDCDSNAANGCEANIYADPANCGGCGRTCTVAHGTAGCVTETCAVSGCATGYADCDRAASNGCETNVLSDPMNCGACLFRCGSNETCVSGSCRCLPGYTSCGAECVNTATDPLNCGGCLNACSTSWSCVDGGCANPAGH